MESHLTTPTDALTYFLTFPPRLKLTKNISLTSAALKQRKWQKGVCWTSRAAKVQRFILSVHSPAGRNALWVIANKSRHIPTRVISVCVFEKWVLYFPWIKSFSNLCCHTRSTASSCNHTRSKTHTRPLFRVSLGADEKRYRTPNPQRSQQPLALGESVPREGCGGKWCVLSALRGVAQSQDVLVLTPIRTLLQRFPSQTSSSFIYQDHRCFTRPHSPWPTTGQPLHDQKNLFSVLLQIVCMLNMWKYKISMLKV